MLRAELLLLVLLLVSGAHSPSTFLVPATVLSNFTCVLTRASQQLCKVSITIISSIVMIIIAFAPLTPPSLCED